jgi:hypothetical protein
MVHLADNEDSQLNGQVLDAARFLTRRASCEVVAKINSKEAFGVVRSRLPKGGTELRKHLRRLSGTVSHRKLNTYFR